MTRNEIEAIAVGQAGLYEWDPSLKVVSASPVHEVLIGRKKGKAYRTVHVESSTGNATISFIVRED